MFDPARTVLFERLLDGLRPDTAMAMTLTVASGSYSVHLGLHLHRIGI